MLKHRCVRRTFHFLYFKLMSMSSLFCRFISIISVI